MAKECPLKIQKVESSETGQALAATLFAEMSNQAPDAPVGLATGGTMSGVYSALASQGFSPRFKDAFALDEYLGISAASENSYANELTRKFAEPLGFQGKLHVPGQGDYAGTRGADDFEAAIAKLGPMSVQLLGLGTNGHIAFNEPGSAFDSRTRIVELHRETIDANSIYFEDPKSMPTHAVTQGLATIKQASNLLLLVFGQAKREAFSKALNDPDDSVPLSALLDHPGLVLITDLDY